MFRAIVTKPFSGVLDGTVMPREFAEGDEITGELAEAAVRFKDAKETKDSKAEREQAAADIAAREAHEASEKAKLEELAKEKATARAEFDKATPEQIAEGAAHLKIDLGGATDRDAIFEMFWTAMLGGREPKA